MAPGSPAIGRLVAWPHRWMSGLALLALAVLVGTAGPALGDSSPPAPDVVWVDDRPGDARTPRDATGLAGGSGSGLAVAFEGRVEAREADGSLRWSSPVDGDVLLVEAFDLTGDGTEDVLAGTGAILDPPSRVAALDGATGETLWSVPSSSWQTNALLAHPPSAPDLVVTSSSEGPGEATVVGRDAATGEPRWNHTTDSPTTTLVAAGGDVLAGTWDGLVQRLDPDTGDVLATAALGDGAAVRDLAALPDGGAIVAAKAHVARVTSDGEVAWTYTAGSAKFASVEVADTDGDGRLEAYVVANDGDHVHALDAEEGTAAWTAGDAGWRRSRQFRQTDNARVLDRPQAGPLVVAGGVPGQLRALDPASGEQRWTVDTPGPSSHLARLPMDAAARIVLPHNYGHLLAVDGHGGLAWAFDLAPVETGAMAAFDGDGVPDVATATNGHVYVHDGATGERLLHHALYPLLPDAVATNVQVADVTGDGVPDAVVTLRNHFVDGVAVAIDGATGERAWTFRTAWIGGVFQPGLLLEDVSGDGIPDALFVGDRGYPTFAHAVDGPTGEELWSYHVEDSVLAIALADPPGTPPVLGIVRDRASCACHSAPALVGIDAQSGTELWEHALDTRPRALAAFRDDEGLARFAVPDLSAGQGLLPISPLQEPRRTLLVVDALTGLPVRTLDATHQSTGDVRLGNHLRAFDLDGTGGDELVYTLLTGGRRSQGGTSVAVLDPDDGEKRWRTPYRSAGVGVLEAGPRQTDGQGRHVLAHWGGSVDGLALLDAGDGSVRWEHATQEDPVRFAGVGVDDGGIQRAAVAEGSRLLGLDPPGS